MDIDVHNLTVQQREYLEQLLLSNFKYAFDEIVDAGWEWLNTPEAASYFQERQDRLTLFFEHSGIHDRWDEIIHERAVNGADIAAQIYNLARQNDVEESLFNYTPAERRVFNQICDNQYELVKDVTEQQVKGIRRQLIEDYAKGVNPRQTSLKQIQLEPINGRSCTQRAEMIARTETARILNSTTLMQYMDEGVEMVELLCVDACPECEKYQGIQIPISEALERPVIHPNCRCSYRDADEGTRYTPDGHRRPIYGN